MELKYLESYVISENRLLSDIETNTSKIFRLLSSADLLNGVLAYLHSIAEDIAYLKAKSSQEDIEENPDSQDPQTPEELESSVDKVLGSSGNGRGRSFKTSEFINPKTGEFYTGAKALAIKNRLASENKSISTAFSVENSINSNLATLIDIMTNIELAICGDVGYKHNIYFPIKNK